MSDRKGWIESYWTIMWAWRGSRGTTYTYIYVYIGIPIGHAVAVGGIRAGKGLLSTAERIKRVQWPDH